MTYLYVYVLGLGILKGCEGLGFRRNRVLFRSRALGLG